jgi:uncharacterized protein (DUF427 family)
MSLTIGTGPFGQRPGGVLNAEPSSGRFLFFEDSPRRVRATFGGETVVDSRRAMLLHEGTHLPVYYFPEEDVRMDLLEPTDHSTHCPYKGDASYWSLRLAGKKAENAAWSYPAPLDGAPPLAGYFAFYWDKLDAWFEEDEQVFGHARDPYHRIDAVPTTRRIRVSVDGEVVAESNRATALFEAGLPTRWYIPGEDVREDLLVASDAHTRCAYKGLASYYSVRVGDEVRENLVWYYPEPTREAEPLSGLLCFYNEKVDVEVDGEREERPQTLWS